MSLNEVSQKKTLFQKIGLGKPQMPSNIKMSQQPSSNPPPKQTPQPLQPNTVQQPTPQTPPPAKPGCGGCRRKKGR